MNGEENEAVSDLLPLEAAETANEERGANAAVRFSPNAMKFPEKATDGHGSFVKEEPYGLDDKPQGLNHIPKDGNDKKTD